MDPTKQSTCSDCRELQNSPQDGAGVCPLEGGACSSRPPPPPPGGATVERPAGRAEAQHADSTCQPPDHLINVSVSKTRAAGGITRGVPDSDPDSSIIRATEKETRSRRLELDDSLATDVMWSGVESAMLDCHDNIKTILRQSGVDPIGDLDDENDIWRNIQNTG